MTIKNPLVFWSGVFALFLVLVWLFKGILLPFIVGAAVAYLLNPVVNKLGRWKIRRGPAALIILSVFLLAMIGLCAALAPVIYDELTDLAADIPDYIDRAAAILAPFTERVQGLVGRTDTDSIKSMVQQNAGSAVHVAGGVMAGLAAGGMAFLNLISLLVIMPIVAYFMMKEWPGMTDKIEDLMPRESKPTIMQLLRDIDKKLAGFVRGQLTVSFLLAIGYAIALSIAGLKYGFLIGICAGLLSIIPLVGSTVGLIVSVLVAWFQSGEWSFVAIVAGIFLIGQFIEGNFLTPKLVGDSVGLHPLWVFFALMAGGALFGIVGMLLAVPVAAVASVLVAFAIRRYKSSSLYKES